MLVGSKDRCRRGFWTASTLRLQVFDGRSLVLKKKYVKDSVFAAKCCRIDSSFVALSLERQVGLMRCLVFKKSISWGVFPQGSARSLQS
jgi:hypothetical protein